MIPKISIIVPVYKAELYLHRCVDSLLSQTFRDFEVLLIDDGSPDKSGEICEEYAQQDSRVRVFHKPNGGVSSARQKGLDEACGEYVIHADPDDWVEPTMLEELYRKAKREDADMVICDYFDNYKDKQSLVVQKPSALDHNTVLRELFQQLHGSCCNKLVRRVCYNEYKIKFHEDLTCKEDWLLNVLFLMHNVKISYLNKAFYHYCYNSNSLTVTRNRKRSIQNNKLIISALSNIPLTKQWYIDYIRDLKLRVCFDTMICRCNNVPVLLDIHYVERREKLGSIINSCLPFFVKMILLMDYFKLNFFVKIVIKILKID